MNMLHPSMALRKIHFVIGLCLLVTTSNLLAKENTWPLAENWRMQSSFLARESGTTLTSSAFTARDWHAVDVPTTVLTALVKAGVYSDPYVGTNNMKIPDAWEPFNKTYGLSQYSHLPSYRNPWKDPYWFWTRFDCPKKISPDQNAWLCLGAINYRADV
jgi:hypothetical protein